MAVNLKDTKSLMAALDSGVDIYNMKTGEFVSVSSEAVLAGLGMGDGSSAHVGKVGFEALENARETCDKGITPMDVSVLMKSLSSKNTSRKMTDDGHVIGWKEAARVAHQDGWVLVDAATVFGDSSFKSKANVASVFGLKANTWSDWRDTWRDVPFAEKREAFDFALSELGFDVGGHAGVIGNPITKKQASYLEDMYLASTYDVPETAAMVAAMGVLSSQEASQVLHRVAQTKAVDGHWPKKYESKVGDIGNLAAMISASHEDYKSKHGTFQPAPERLGVDWTERVGVSRRQLDDDWFDADAFLAGDVFSQEDAMFVDGGIGVPEPVVSEEFDEQAYLDGEPFAHDVSLDVPETGWGKPITLAESLALGRRSVPDVSDIRGVEDDLYAEF